MILHTGDRILNIKIKKYSISLKSTGNKYKYVLNLIYWGVGWSFIGNRLLVKLVEYMAGYLTGIKPIVNKCYFNRNN